MNHSLMTADRTTHLKMVVVSLVAAIIVVVVGISARLSETRETTARLQSAPVMKAEKAVTFTSTEAVRVR
jgi:hypothetical protein